MTTLSSSTSPRLRPLIRSSKLSSYIIAAVAVALATGLNILLERYVQPQVTSLFIAAVMVAAWWGGLMPGLFATVLAGIASIFLFIDPLYSFELDTEDIFRLAVFLMVALLVSWLNARRKDAEAALDAERRDLEVKVADRTLDLLEQQKKLRDLTWQLSQTEEQERRRIAAALHDGLGQLLAVATIKVDSLCDGNGRCNNEEVVQVRRLLDEALTQTRSLTIDLSPPVLYELGLKAAVVWLAQEMENRYKLKVEVVCATLPEIDDVTRSVVFHAIRELLINVAKHAGSGSARVVISHGRGQLDVLVEDQGTGFDIAGVLSPASGRSGFGLFNVRERIHHLTGTFQVSPGETKGTRVHLMVPVSGNGAAT